MGFRIEGLGTATPTYGVRQEDAAAIAETLTGGSEGRARAIRGLYGRSGVRFRHSVALDSGEPRRDNLIGQANDGEFVGATRSPVFSTLDQDATTVTVKPPPTELDRPSIRQSFYPPSSGLDDRGPSTATRLDAYEKHAGPLAVQAVSRALDSAGWNPQDVTHLITISCTGFAAPGIDMALISGCGLNRSVQRTHVGFMGCHGALNGLRVAKAFADSDPSARILVCAVELCSLHQQYGLDPEHIVSNALFADGAAAVVGCGTRVDDTQQQPPFSSVVATGSSVIVETDDLMGWRIGDHGFEMSLSAQVPNVIEQTLRQWMVRWLSEHELSMEQIRGWAIHPGGPKILRACANALSLDDQQWSVSKSVLAEFGNMSSPTVLFVLQRLLNEGESMPCVMLAFGPGLSIEAALLR